MNGKLGLGMANNARMTEMSECLADAPKEILPSKFWEGLNQRHLALLEEFGYQNFKRTLSTTYFTFLPGLRHVQTQTLMKNLPPALVLKSFIKALRVKRHDFFSYKESFYYNFFTYLLWDYVRTRSTGNDLAKLAEPLEGNPLKLYVGKKLISQDLANSFLEFKAILDSGINRSAIKTVMELGAGYGRTAYVFLELLPDVKYIIVDFPPALFISETYLSNQFPKKKIFKFRPFDSYTEIEAELSKADIAFFLPTQIHRIPKKSIDLFISISSFHEMRLDQIHYYFDRIDELSNYLYFKQSKISHPYEARSILESDYPVRQAWDKIFWRDCPVQPSCFEALLSL